MITFHLIAIIFFGLLALGWVTQTASAAPGLLRIPRIAQIAPAEGDHLPRISVLFAARDEEKKLAAALSSMLELDYPDYEVIAVDDRSTDGTGELLDQFARGNPHLRVLHITELPSGWLGKPHALEAAAAISTGDWLLFTDADVRFDPLILRRAFALAEERNWDHLTLLANVDLHGFWERVIISYFGFGLIFGAQAWKVSDPKSTKYMGVGAFQLVRRTAYESSGTHCRLALEVADDMKLGKILKQSGFRSGVAGADGMVRVRWQDGAGNIVRGVTKNMFGAVNFSPSLALTSVAIVLVSGVAPFAGAVFASGLARIFAIIAALTAAMVQGEMFHATGESRLYGLTHPIGALIFCYMMLRSMIVTLRQGGVIWRDTFYPLDELRRGMV